MGKILEFMVRKTTRYIVTRYEKAEKASSVSSICECVSEADADDIASAMALHNKGIYRGSSDLVGNELILLEDKYPDFREIAVSKEFSQWLYSQGDEIMTLFKSDSAENSIKVLDAYSGKK